MLDREIQTLQHNLGEVKERFATLENKVKRMDGTVLTKKKLDAIQPEAGMMVTVKGVSLEEIKNLKRTAVEFYILNEKMADLSRKYVALKGKVPTEAEKLETAQKIAMLRQLQQDKAHLETALRSHGIDLKTGKDLEKGISQNRG